MKYKNNLTSLYADEYQVSDIQPIWTCCKSALIRYHYRRRDDITHAKW
jgi:hypothetical protein